MPDPPLTESLVVDLREMALEKTLTELPEVSGWVYTVRDKTPAGNTIRVLCTPFNLDIPATDLYDELQKASFADPHRLTAAINLVVNECILAHATVKRVGSENIKRPPYTRPVPVNQCTSYLLYYGMSNSAYNGIAETWDDCVICGQKYKYHVVDACPSYLGERFLSREDGGLKQLSRLLQFSNSLPAWALKHSDSIFRLALERLNGKQKTKAGIGCYPGGEFGEKATRPVGDSEAAGVGLGDSVS